MLVFSIPLVAALQACSARRDSVLQALEQYGGGGAYEMSHAV
jgi:hypothetical protein